LATKFTSHVLGFSDTLAQFQSGNSQLSQYITSQIETRSPVFQAVADGYHQYYDPGWENDMVDE
jgi:hypothetical protein